MMLKLVTCVAAIVLLIGPAFADDVIYNGLHCNGLCQRWMGISPDRPAQRKLGCAHVVSHVGQYDAELVQLCRFATGRPYG
jgi:hypothetical protein